MRRLLLILSLLLVIDLTFSDELVLNLGGIQGNSLLRDLTNNSTSNATLNTLGNTINLSQLGGGANTIFKSLNDTDKGLSSWGSTPREAPLPPVMNYDPNPTRGTCP